MVELGFPGHLNAWVDIKTTALPEPQIKTFPYRSTTTCSCVGVLSLRMYFPLYWKEFCLSKISKICQWSGLLLCVVWVTQSCPTLGDPMDCSPPGFSVHGILQARILKWVAVPFFKGSSWPRDRIQVSGIAVRFFTWAIFNWAIREAHLCSVLTNLLWG